MPQTTTATRPQRKVLVGTVLSTKMMKTIVVRVERQVRHPKYGRVIRRAATFKAHHERRDISVGDVVKIMECRPLSRQKRWRLLEVVQHASSAPPVPGLDSERPQASTPPEESGR